MHRFHPHSVTRTLAFAAAILSFAPSTTSAAGPGEIGLDERSIEVFEESGTLFARVERSRGEDGTVGVDWETVDGTAHAGLDYVGSSGTLTWGPQDGSDRILEIGLIDDDDAEGVETFEIRLSNPTGGAVLRTGRETSTGVILASDGGTGGGGGGDDGGGGRPGTLKFSSTLYQVVESQPTATILVERSRGETGAVTVSFQTLPGSATPGEDYDPVSRTLRWAAGDGSDRRVTIPIVADAVDEANETVSLVLLDPTGGASLGERAVATLTIVDDDTGGGGSTPQCAGGETTLCLQDSRFELTGSWSTAQGTSGPIRAVPITDDSGLFWFFDAANLELLVKVIDGCAINDRFWVFAAGTTNVEWTLQVRDLPTGTTKTYHNPQGVDTAATTDTEAFASCP